MPRFQLGKLFKTGWARKPRDSEGNIIGASITQSKEAPKETVKETAERQMVTRVVDKAAEVVSSAAAMLQTQLVEPVLAAVPTLAPQDVLVATKPAI